MTRRTKFMLHLKDLRIEALEQKLDKAHNELDTLAEEHSDLIVEKDHLFDEVVRLRAVLDEYEETSGLKQAKTDVAREIISETFKMVRENFVNTPIFKVGLSDLEAELKKKYTENCTTCAHVVSCEPNPFGACEEYERIEKWE